MTKINRITRADVDGFAAAGQAASLDGYRRIATKSAIYPGQGTPRGVEYVALKLNGEAGEFAEHLGKAMRDAGFGEIIVDPETKEFLGVYDYLAPERRAALLKELGDVLWYVSAGCNELGVSLSEVALMNLEKLCDRGERDALRGSGDER